MKFLIKFFISYLAKLGNNSLKLQKFNFMIKVSLEIIIRPKCNETSIKLAIARVIIMMNRACYETCVAPANTGKI